MVQNRASIPPANAKSRITSDGQGYHPAPGRSYPEIYAVVIGVAAGVALAAATGEAAHMLAGLLVGVALALWLSGRNR